MAQKNVNQIHDRSEKMHDRTQTKRLRVARELVVGWELDAEALSILLSQVPEHIRRELGKREKLFCCRECAAHVPAVLLGEPATSIPNYCEVCAAPVALKLVS